MAAANQPASRTPAIPSAPIAPISAASSTVTPPSATDERVGATTSDRPTGEGSTRIGTRKSTMPPRTRKPASATGQATGWARAARSDETRIVPTLTGQGWATLRATG